MMHELRIDVWSDIACPWCYVGKRRLEAALQRFPQRDSVHVIWRAFELNPSAEPEIRDGASYPERLAKKYGMPVRDARAMITRMTEVANADGLAFRFEGIRPGNTFDAHRLIHLGLERGIQDAVKERFLRAYLTEGEPIGDKATLLRLSEEAGLESQDAAALLGSDAYAQNVRADEHEAEKLGIRGVPFFILAGRFAISGAQPAELLALALTQAWRELTSDAPPDAAGGPVCGPGGCE